MRKDQALQPSWNRAGERALLLLVILAGAALRVWQIGAKGFWGDEIWTAQRSIWPMPQIVDFSLEHTIGPWTYLANRVSLSLLGVDLQEFVLRWPSAVAGILTIPVVWALGRRLWGERPALLAAALVALSPYQVWYAQEARYYIWLVLFATASSYCLYRAFEQPRRAVWWAGFSAATILNIYNHPLSALLVAAGQLPFCLFYGFRRAGGWPRSVGLAVSCGAIALACLPLALRIMTAGQLNSEEAALVFSPSLVDWLEVWLEIQGEQAARFGADGWAGVLFLACAILGVAALAVARDWRALLLLGAPLLAAPLFFAFMKYVFILRYVLFLQPLYLLLVARGVLALAGSGAWLAGKANARSRAAALGSALAATAAALLLLTSLATTAAGYKQAKVIDWRSLAAYLETHAQPQDLVVGRYIWTTAALRWYLDPTAQLAVFSGHEADAAVIHSGTKQIWLILPTEQPLDPADAADPLAQLDLTLVEDWQDARLNYDAGFFPISELSASLYVAQVATSWITFGEVPQPNWTDRSYDQLAPGDALNFRLTLSNDTGRELWITYFDHPDKELEISIGGQMAGVIGGAGGDWQTARFPVPDGLGQVVDVTIRAAGAGIGAVSHAELRAEAP